MIILIGIIFSLIMGKLLESASAIEDEGLSVVLVLTLFLILAFVVGNGLTNLY